MLPYGAGGQCDTVTSDITTNVPAGTRQYIASYDYKHVDLSSRHIGVNIITSVTTY